MTIKAAQRALTGMCLVILVQVSAVASEPERGADPVDMQTATCVAQRHLLRLGVADTVSISDTRLMPVSAGGPALYYCFDLQPQGYIIVCGARSLPPVIAYSLESDAGCDLEPGNPLADLLAWDLQGRLAQADQLPAAAAAQRRAAWDEYLAAAAPLRGRLFQQWPPAGSTPTGGWLLTNWHQSAPYNNLCPLDLVAGARSVAGCPAVAIAQIVNYHARLNGTHFDDGDDYYHNYGGNQFWIDNAYLTRGFPPWPQLNMRLTTLFDNYFNGTLPTDTSKAALVYACGVAAQQVYSASVSGTFGVSQALDSFQRFGCTTADLLDGNDPALEARLSQNMMDAFPALLAVVNTGWTVGHNLVVDGYNTDDYYHFNFGWGGSYNGWYQLLVGMPYQLTVIEGLILDVMIDPCAPMDGTCDGVINWQDFTYFRQCLAGPGVSCDAPGCAVFDGDADGDVDLSDFRVFQTSFGA